MDRKQKIDIILEEVDQDYTIPSYMEKIVRRSINRALNRIEKQDVATSQQEG